MATSREISIKRLFTLIEQPQKLDIAKATLIDIRKNIESKLMVGLHREKKKDYSYSLFQSKTEANDDEENHFDTFKYIIDADKLLRILIDRPEYHEEFDSLLKVMTLDLITSEDFANIICGCLTSKDTNLIKGSSIDVLIH